MFDRLEEITKAEQETAGRFDHTVDVCVAAGCMSSQSVAIKEALEKEVEAHGQGHRCRVRGTGCMGLCAAGPLITVDAEKPGEIMYKQVTVGEACDIVASLYSTPV